MPNKTRKFKEGSFENVFLKLFMEKHQGVYEYRPGEEIHRTNEEILMLGDFKAYLTRRYSGLDLQDYEIEKIVNNLETAKDTSLYRTMNKTLEVLRNGFILDRSELGLPQEFIEYFDWNNFENNSFQIVNQYEVKDVKLRKPDVVVFINGIPVSVIELKDITNVKTTLARAYKQVHERYTRDIPSLMRYSFVTVISDGVNTKMGSLFAKSHKYFYSWKSVNGFSYAGNGFASLLTLIEGLYDPKTLLNIIKNYVYFPDVDNSIGKGLAAKQLMILPKYSQYYASEVLFENIKRHMRPEGDGKGGTYFGATGCGKSYTMLFLSRRITTSKELNNPTIVLLTDRTDLDDQLSEIFESSKKFLIDSNAVQIGSRRELNDKLRGIESGGIYLMTVQKFDDDVGLLSDRTNIICISDEAHRTQVNLDVKYEIEGKSIKKKYGFATYLRNSFPKATYVGFTGTPIDATLQVFGPIVISYKMKQAVEDGATVTIKFLPGPSSVRLDETKIKIVDRYYEERLRQGTNKYQVEQSKKEMATIRTIIDNDSRLDVVVNHIIDHYECRVRENSTINGKAMIVCYDRNIAFKVYKKIISLRPQWNVERKSQKDDSELTDEEIRILKPIAMVKLVATRDKDDEIDLYNLLGDDNYRRELAHLFKDQNSNFKIAILVDMWMTGFDCESLDTMYIDKPLEKHSLVQTISRVNRVCGDKESGLIVDYVGLESALEEAMRLYGGDDEVPVENVEVSYVIFKDQLQILDDIMANFDVRKFIDGDDRARFDALMNGVEFVMVKKENQDRFVYTCLRMKKAYDICVGDERITDDEVAKVHFYCGIRSAIIKTSGDHPDAEIMNQEVKKLVDACISAYGMNQSVDEVVVPTDIFSNEFVKKIEQIPYKNTRFNMLLELLRRAIKEYGKTNKMKAKEFSVRMKELVDKYNDRDAKLLVSNEDVISDFIDQLSDEARKILEDLQKDANEFKAMGISFEEKAFYDILKSIRDKYEFEYEDKKLIALSKKVKELVDDKSKYVDWSSKADIQAGFKADIMRLLSKNGYPPKTIEDFYKSVMEQLENFKRNHD